MLQTTDKLTGNEFLGNQATKNRRNQDLPSGVGGRGVDRDIKNLAFIVKLAKSKKPNFVKSNSFGTEFLILGAKKAFTHLWKAFT